ncbi:R3H domain-containing nucleic acid-binding protein [Myxococcus landrumensis]|uniref:AAA family ATPase n=1 Tax=Myxococcus landrumensis TaxID=2813577 RepID=A0ABX7N1I2_9BACT|nr:R3H domain-containing nucleic acid-binding protein [Myxococcus landrumus]QSQ12343.1 AAA family ATPase [Myxococcus landrumus]
MTSSRVDAAAVDDFLLLVEVLPEELRAVVRALAPEQVLEVVLDLGRAPEARLVDRVVKLRESPVGPEDLAQVMAQVGTPGEDNRAGIERTLHRVSAIRNRRGQVVGLTLRVGRAVYGTIDMLKDFISSGRNVLLLGRPGVGKTTKLREVARVLADDLGKRVMVVDTSNEIGGDGDVPHPGIGGARRMQVSRPDRQHDVMIEAVENHMPEAIIVDEIGTSAEAAAARTIAERGVQLVATAHGNTLENLVLNPTLSDLVGGVHTVTLSDDEARRRRTQKTVSERKAPPTFDIVVEMVSRDEVRVHANTAEAVDRLLSGKDVGGERRWQDMASGRMEVAPSKATEVEKAPPKDVAPPQVATTMGPVENVASPVPAAAEPRVTRFGPRPSEDSPDAVPSEDLRGLTRIYAHSVSRDLLQKVLRELPVEARLVSRMESADLVVTVRSKANDPRMRRVVAKTGARVESVKRSSTAELRRALKGFFNMLEGVDEEEVREAVAEAEQAIQRALHEGISVPLSPRQPRLRKLQHRLVSRYPLEAVSHGSEPSRHLVVYPLGAEVEAALAKEDVEGNA